MQFKDHKINAGLACVLSFPFIVVQKTSCRANFLTKFSTNMQTDDSKLTLKYRHAQNPNL